MNMCNARAADRNEVPRGKRDLTGVKWLGRVSIAAARPVRVGGSARDSGPRDDGRSRRRCWCGVSETSPKVPALHAQVAKDPMTQVANRAEFDRMLNNFVAAHQESNLPCSLIMSDIDHFKAINDTFGHQAGDEAIITFASLLKSMCRSGDLVARYGGENCGAKADCTNAAGPQGGGTRRCRSQHLPATSRSRRASA
jgi:GGDEF domain-containing protein